MVRKLKFHEQKLLKKVDFITWKVDNSSRENKILRRYHIQKREDYTKYNKLSREIRELTEKIARLDATDPFKSEATDMLMHKLHAMGVANDNLTLESASKTSASHFCRRRLPVVMVKLRMSEGLKHATGLIEQGHVRVGPEVVKDPAFLVSRNLEDFVTWVDGSKIKQHVQQYNDLRDDFQM
ncbi:U3 small nucleolar ribonucleoprotein protein IMP3 [Drosophila sulfurigaster albostrigata]|uniref:U3 small nucleolar ribonucleoprotein protein IMP3 n=1 Tax=Drosophila sulfurigaster albostrigata TaxID=89887 RepID=UPI002D21B9B7|nr:U3 small nucleolar ribonucleoprotein protein IMP3 [Drosophila sulfurigaster albostrigata]